MKLLLDENLSDQIIRRIVDLYPNSEHVKTLGLTNTDDELIWEYAKANGFVIVSKDSDFHQRSPARSPSEHSASLSGPPVTLQPRAVTPGFLLPATAREKAGDSGEEEDG